MLQYPPVNGNPISLPIKKEGVPSGFPHHPWYPTAVLGMIPMNIQGHHLRPSRPDLGHDEDLTGDWNAWHASF
jgi:hypothetical protein